MWSGAHSAVWAGASPGAELLPARTAPCGPGAGHRTLQHAVRRARCRFGGARPGRRTPTGAHGTVSSGIRARDRSACGPARGTVPFGRGATRAPNTCQRRPGAHGAVRFGNRARNRAACGPARTVPFGRGGARAPNTCRRARCRAVRKPGTGPRCVQSGQHVAVWAGGGPGEEHLPARTAPCGPEALHGTARRAVWRARAVWVGRGPYSAVWARPKPNMNVYFRTFHHLSTISTYFSSNS